MAGETENRQKQPRAQRTNEELKEIIVHLRYEKEMLFHLADLMRSRGHGTNTIIGNALIESFVVHARVLLDFLFADRPRDDDVIAEDFLLDKAKWQTTRSSKTASLQKIHGRVGKEVAHLTYFRSKLTEEQKRWPFGKIADEIDSVFKEFLSIAPEAILGNDWGNRTPKPSIHAVDNTIGL